MSVTTRPAVNVADFNYYSQTLPFLDLVKSAAVGWAGPAGTYLGTDGWLRGVPAGTGNSTKIIRVSDIALATQEMRFRTGDYYVTWTGTMNASIQAGTGLTVSGGGYGLVSANRFKFAVTQNPPPIITLQVSGPTSGTADLLNIRVFYANDEAALDAGEIFEPHFLNSIRPFDVLRFMDWFAASIMGFDESGNIVITPSIEHSNFGSEANCYWSATGGAAPTFGQAAPPSLLGKLGKTLGKDIWVSMPTMCSYTCMLAVFQDIYDTGFVGRVYAEYTNETWNQAAPWIFGRNWLRDVKAAGTDVDGSGSPLTIYDNSGAVVPWASASAGLKSMAGLAHGSLQCWKAAEQVFGRNRVIRCMNGQATFAFENQSTLKYIDPGILQTSARLRELLDQYAIAPYYYMQVTGSIPAIDVKSLCNQKAYNLSDSAWTDSFKQYIEDYLVPGVTSNRAMLDENYSNIKLTSYEGGQSVQPGNISFRQFSAMHDFTINTADNTLLSAIDITSAFDTGEQARNGHNGSPSSGLAAETTCYVRHISSTKIRLYPTLTDATNDTNAFALDGSTATTYKFDNYTRIVALDAKFKGIIDNDAGYAFEDYYYQRVFRDKLTLMNHYFSTGGWSYNAVWGLTRNQFDPRTRTHQWFEDAFRDIGVTLNSESTFPSTMEPQTNPVVVSTWT